MIMETKITYCPDCGEYLGDIANGTLFKFGQRVTEPHICHAPSNDIFEMSGKTGAKLQDILTHLFMKDYDRATETLREVIAKSVYFATREV